MQMLWLQVQERGQLVMVMVMEIEIVMIRIMVVMMSKSYIQVVLKNNLRKRGAAYKSPKKGKKNFRDMQFKRFVDSFVEKASHPLIMLGKR
jgi:hypothetical protein